MHYSTEPRDWTASKRAIQKTAGANGNLVGKKIVYKIGKASKNNPEEKAKNEIEIPKERYISPDKRQKIIDELRLV